MALQVLSGKLKEYCAIICHDPLECFATDPNHLETMVTSDQIRILKNGLETRRSLTQNFVATHPMVHSTLIFDISPKHIFVSGAICTHRQLIDGSVAHVTTLITDHVHGQCSPPLPIGWKESLPILIGQAVYVAMLPWSRDVTQFLPPKFWQR